MKYLFPPIPDLCHCGCGEIVWGGKKWIKLHNIRINNPSKKGRIPWNKGKRGCQKAWNKNPYPKIPSLCECGCNEIVWNGKQYKSGHHSKINNFFKNKHHTKESKEKISIAKKGKYSGKNHPLYGKHHSEETKRKISKSHEGIQLGKNNGMYGKHHTDKIKKIMSEKKKGKYCGNLNPSKRPEVRAKISKALKGKYCREKSSNWKGGIAYLPYCYKFNGRLKDEIRKRDNYQCQNPNCLCAQLESLVIYNKKLLIHHIHYDKENCYPDLITLCQSCNSKVNGNRDYWEEYFMNILKDRNLLNWKYKKEE